MPNRDARNAVYYAITHGKLAPPEGQLCFDCQEPAVQYDHYLGYDRAHWLDVQAVCLSCHWKRTSPYQHYCQRCERWWNADTKNPRCCGKCKSPGWNKPRKWENRARRRNY